MSLATVSARSAALACTVLTALAGAGTALASPTTDRNEAAATSGRHRPDPLRPYSSRTNDVVSSSNWSGYAVQSAGKFTDVRGTWIQPRVSCTRSKSYSAFWAGLDGYSSGSVEQIGTDSDCVGGTPSNYAWYEMYPSGPVVLSRARYPVHAKDRLTASVSVRASTFRLTLKSSAGWTYATTRTEAGLAQSSAELIVESPEACGLFCQLAPLSNFGIVNFTGARAAVNGGADRRLGSFTYASGPHRIIAETNSGQVKAQPSGLTATPSGSAFSVTWRHS